MAKEQVSVEGFRGLNLLEDPNELGWEFAVDLLNVDFDDVGRVRTRDGARVFTAVAADAPIHSIAPFYTTDGDRQLVIVWGGASGGIAALDEDGVVIDSDSGALFNSAHCSFARISTPGTEELWCHINPAPGFFGTVRVWDGTAFVSPVRSYPGTGPATGVGRYICVTGDGRLLEARVGGAAEGVSVSTVMVSDPHDPYTRHTDNYFELTPGDGEEVLGVCAWREFTFVFKQTKFAVLSPPRADASGQPLLVPRMVLGEGIYAARGVAVAPHGVYFVNRRGVWLTRGGDPELVTARVDPVFRGTQVPLFEGAALNQEAIDVVALAWADNRLWVSYPSGVSTVNDALLVFDPSRDSWSLYDFNAASMAAFRAEGREELAFGAVGDPIALTPPDVISADLDIGGTPGSTIEGEFVYSITAYNATGETTAGLTGAAGPYVNEVDSHIRVEWTPVVGATGYKLYREVLWGSMPSGVVDVGNVTAYNDDEDGAEYVPGTPPLTNTATVTAADVLLHGPDYTVDGGDGVTPGAAISARYRSGLDALGERTDKVVREWLVEGSGTVDFEALTEYEDPAGGETLALGAVPGGQQHSRVSVRGLHVGFLLSSTVRFSVSAVTAFVRRKARSGDAA
jgi:hypothetical protein